MSSYSPRPVTSYGVREVNGWPTKLYGVAVTGRPGDALIAAAVAKAAEALPATPEPDSAAFVIAHQARPANFVLVYWWATPVDLRLKYYRSPLDRPADLESLPPEATGCIWELGITAHERASWIRHRLQAADLPAYLADTTLTEV